VPQNNKNTNNNVRTSSDEAFGYVPLEKDSLFCLELTLGGGSNQNDDGIACKTSLTAIEATRVIAPRLAQIHVQNPSYTIFHF